MTGAQILVECLLKEGVDTVFGYPGGAVLSIYDSLARSKIRHVLVRHEQGAGHAADGYSRASGKVGVCIATSGPGSTNLVTGIASAYMDSIPLIAITGQVPVTGLGSDCFQEADITGITIPVTKHNYLVKDVKELPRIVKEAFHIASTGRPGPVLIDLPRDVSADISEFRYPRSVNLPGYKPSFRGHPTQIKRAAARINEARKPVILSGGGVIRSGSAPELLALAQKASVPVVVTLMGVTSFPGSHPLYLGMVGMHGTHAANRAIMESDLIIAFGTRFAERSTGETSGYAPDAHIIHIDVDPAEIGKNVRADTPIVGDARQILKALLPLVEETQRDSWLKTVGSWKREINAVPEGAEGLDPLEVIEEVFQTAGQDAIITTDVGQHQMWAAQVWKEGNPGSLICSGGLGAMGYGLPAAIGAKAGSPAKTVINITGDGSFQMNMQEMSTAVAYGFPVKVMILNNSCLGMVRQLQEYYCDKRYYAVDLTPNPDFVKLAEAYQVAGFRVEKQEDVVPTIRKALAHEGPAIVDFRICPDANVFPMVSPGDSLDRMIGA